MKERKQVHVYLNDRERAILEQLAATRGLSLTAYMRMLILDRAVDLEDRPIARSPKERQPEYV